MRGRGGDRGKGDVAKIGSPTCIASLTGAVPSGNSFGICTENVKMPPLYSPCRTKTTPTHTAERANQHMYVLRSSPGPQGSPNGLRVGTTYTPGGQQRRSKLLESRSTQHPPYKPFTAVTLPPLNAYSLLGGQLVLQDVVGVRAQVEASFRRHSLPLSRCWLSSQRLNLLRAGHFIRRYT